MKEKTVKGGGEFKNWPKSHDVIYEWPLSFKIFIQICFLAPFNQGRENLH
jgi:hypothetical protein